jgi:hypothetical protein
MTPLATSERYKHHRFPGAIISHGVWLYSHFTLSYRDVQALLFERGVTVSHEAIHQWCRKFGQDCANRLRRRVTLITDGVSILQTKISYREWHEARRIGLEAVPLDEDIEGRHGECEARPEVRLRMFGDGAYLLIDLVEQCCDKIEGDHALLRAWQGVTLSTSVEEVHDHDNKTSKYYRVHWFVRD